MPIRPTTGLAPALTPHGRLRLASADDAAALPPDAEAVLREAFARGTSQGLVQRGAGEIGTTVPAVFSYWRELGALIVGALCTAPDVAFGRGSGDGPLPPREPLRALAAAAPPIPIDRTVPTY